MGSGQRVGWESVRSQFEKAESAEDPRERRHHVREALQLLEGVQRS